jgi:hypothetical protein
MLPGSSGLSISSVVATVRYATNTTTSLSSLTGRFYSGASTALGSGTTAITRTANTIASATVTLSSPTYAQMADLRLRVVGTRPSSSTQSILYVYWVTVEVTYTGGTWPVAAKGPFTIFSRPGSPFLGPATASATSNYTMGTQFWVNGTGKYLRGIIFYRPPELVTNLVTGALFKVADGSEVANSRINWGPLNLDAPRWEVRYLPATVPLTPGEQYVVACHFPDKSPAVGHSWTDQVHGPVTAPMGPNARFTAGTSLAFPSTAGAEQAYFVDPIVADETYSLPPLSPYRQLRYRGFGRRRR